MSTTIDQRVVEMQFDNRHFENNVKTTMSTLDKLKQSLNFTGASKGLENINTAARKVDFSGMSSGIEQVGVKFSYLQATIQHQLNNIVDSAVTAGKRMASALTIDPIKTGFSEYETQINAVQTILANTESKGTTLNDVNAALDVLNTYADKTIYNFTEMTRNIGTFTAAGIELDTATNAIQGIANLAAVSGSTSQQASTAMYQLSQALASGTVKLMDWNSVVNAGMGGQVFQDALKETARVHGVAIDDMIKKNGSFRETLKDGWITSEILTETLSHFTMAAEEGTDQWEKYKKSLMDQGYSEEQAKSILKLSNTATDAATKVKTATQLWDTLKEAAQSGWTQTWELIVGDFGEAKELWTSISDTVGKMIGDSANARNTLLSGALDTNWEKMVNKINEAGIESTKFEEKLRKTMEQHGLNVDALIEEHGSLEKVFRSGAVSSDILKEAVDSLSGSMVDLSTIERELKKGLKGDDVKLAQEALKNLDFDLGKAGVDGVFGSQTEAAVKAFQELKGLEVTGIIDEKTLAALEEANKSTVNLTESCKGFISAITELGGREKIIESLKNVFQGLMNIVSPIKKAFREIFPPITVEQVSNFIDKFRNLTERFETFTEKHGPQIERTFKGVFSVLDIGWTVVKELGSGLVELIGYFAGFSGGILEATASFGDWLTNLRDTVKETDIFGTTIGSIVGFLGKCIDKLKEFGISITESFGNPKLEGFIGFFKGLWGIVTKVGSAIAKTLGSVGKTIAEVLGKGDIFEVINTGLLTGIVFTIQKFTKSLSDGFDSVGGFLENVTGILEDVRGCFEAYQNQLKAGTLIKIASAIAILTAAIFVLSTIEPDRLGASLGAITVLFGELVGSLALFNKLAPELKGIVKTVALMIGMSVAITILAGALKKISSINWGGLAKGLIGVGALMAELALFLKFAKLDGRITTSAIGIVILSSALLILAKAVKNFGNMSWGEIGKGLAAIAGLLVEIAVFSRFAGNGGKVLGTGIAMIFLGTAMKIFASAIKDLGGMNLATIGKGLLAIAGTLTAVTIAMRFMPKNMISIGIGMIAVSAAMKILANVLTDFGGLSWGEIGRGLVAMGGALLELSIALNLMRGTLAGSAALVVAAGALAIIVPVMKSLGNMSWSEIGKGLAALAGAFVVVGVAGLLLKPLIPTLIGLAAAFALFGVSTVLIGAGLTAIAAGFTALATAGAAGASAIVAALTVIIIGILDLIPSIANAIGRGIVEICKVIGDYAPQIAESALKLIAEVMKALATYTPQIVDSLLVFLIDVMNTLADHMPELIEAAMNLVGALFEGIALALNNFDGSNILKGTLAVAIMTVLVKALAGVGPFIPGAMAGLLGVGLVIAELALVLAAIGGLAQIPGLSWLIEEGGDFLEKIGTAIGQFVGGLAGGIAQGFTNSLPDIGTDLSIFMQNIQPFIDGAKNIDKSVLEGVGSLTAAIALITGAEIIDSIASWLTGGSSFADFAEQLVPFGKALKEYSDTVSGIDNDAITSSANAAKALSELANGLPNSGGLAALFTGDNNIAVFGLQLVPFGMAMKAYADSIKGIDADAITSSANAAKSLAELANNVPNSGGLVSLFTGENSLASFGTQLAPFGKAMKEYADEIDGIDAGVITASANAASALSELASNIPNSGGLVSLFAGDNSLSTFASQLAPFGKAMKEYADEIDGIDVDAVTASANAASALSELASNLPNSGGLISWFTGDNDLNSFGDQIVVFGEAMKDYADKVDGIDSEAVTASAIAAKSLSELAANLPNSGGLVSWFTGDNSLSSFGDQLVPFGEGMKEYADAVKGIDADAVIASANAAKSLSELATNLPNDGGVASWFTGDNNLGNFAEGLEPFGKGMKAYADEIKGIDTDAVTASANAAKTISELATNLPNNGGVVSWFTGDNSLGDFANQLEPFGKGMKSYADSVKGIDADSVISSTNAAKALSELADNLPNSSIMASLFAGENNLFTFGAQLTPFGRAMKSYADSVSGIDAESVTASANAAKTLSELATNLPNSGGLATLFIGDNSLATFGYQLAPFGQCMKAYANSVSGINEESVIASANAAKTLSELATNLPNSGGLVSIFNGDNGLATFGYQLAPFGRSMKAYADSVAGINEESVIASANAAKSLSELANNLPTTTSPLMALLTGDNSLSTFGMQLVPFGKGMKAYSDSVSGIDADSVTASANAAKALAELANNLPSSGGIFEIFKGDNDISSIVLKLVPLGKAMKLYSDAIVGIDTEAITNSAGAAKSLVKVINNLSEGNGLLDLFSGNSGISSFIANLPQLGGGLKKYSDSVIGIDITAVSSSVTAMTKLKDLVNNLAGINAGGVSSFKNAIEELGTIQVGNISKAFTAAIPNLTNIGGNLIDAIVRGMRSKQGVLTSTTSGIIAQLVSSMNKAVTVFSTSGTALMDKFISGIRSKQGNLMSVITAIVNLTVNAAKKLIPLLGTTGAESMIHFANGLRSQSVTVSTAISTSIASGVSTARGYYGSFYSAGSYLVDGFASGISANTWKAEAEARAMADAADQAARAALGIKSPSRAFYAIGEFVGQGFTNALGDYSSKTYEAGASMADYARKGLSNAIGKVQEILNSDMDTQPTIRPVLDLSNIQSGAAAINGMFSDGPTVGVMSNVNSISSMMNDRIQNGVNDDIISAINKLGNSLSNIGGTTYSINGITYDDGSNISDAIKTIARVAKMERRI